MAESAGTKANQCYQNLHWSGPRRPQTIHQIPMKNLPVHLHKQVLIHWDAQAKSTDDTDTFEALWRTRVDHRW